MNRAGEALTAGARALSGRLPTRLLTLRLLSRHSYDIRRTIVVAGTPRSGTTWVASLLDAIPGASILFEPLHLDRVRAARDAGFGWRTYIAPEAEWPQGERFMRRALEGRVLNGWTTREIGRVHRTTTWIVKFVRANRMLGWITERFPVRAPLLVLRHPCAVVASQLAYPWWSERSGSVDPKVLDAHPGFREIVDQLEAPEELLAADWAIDVALPLALPKPYPWELVTYEQLVLRPETEVRRVFDRWSLPIPDGIWSRLDVPSSMTNPRLGARVQEEMIGGWQRRLGAEQVQRVLGVARAFGLDLYNADVQPDERSLATLTLND